MYKDFEIHVLSKEGIYVCFKKTKCIVFFFSLGLDPTHQPPKNQRKNINKSMQESHRLTASVIRNQIQMMAVAVKRKQRKEDIKMRQIVIRIRIKNVAKRKKQRNLWRGIHHHHQMFPVVNLVRKIGTIDTKNNLRSIRNINLNLRKRKIETEFGVF